MTKTITIRVSEAEAAAIEVAKKITGEKTASKAILAAVIAHNHQARKIAILEDAYLEARKQNQVKLWED